MRSFLLLKSIGTNIEQASKTKNSTPIKRKAAKEHRIELVTTIQHWDCERKAETRVTVEKIQLSEDLIIKKRKLYARFIFVLMKSQVKVI